MTSAIIHKPRGRPFNEQPEEMFVDKTVRWRDECFAQFSSLVAIDKLRFRLVTTQWRRSGIIPHRISLHVFCVTEDCGLSASDTELHRSRTGVCSGRRLCQSPSSAFRRMTTVTKQLSALFAVAQSDAFLQRNNPSAYNFFPAGSSSSGAVGRHGGVPCSASAPNFSAAMQRMDAQCTALNELK